MTAEDRIREAWLAARDPAPKEDCSPGDRLWSAAAGELDGSALRDVLDHVAVCPHCTEDWRLAGEVRAGSGLARPVEGQGVVRISPRARWVVWAGAAAAVLSALMIFGPRMLQQREAPVFRDAGRDAVRALSDSTLFRDKCVLRWSPGPAGSRYKLVVATESDGVIHKVLDLDEAQYVVPEAALRDVAAGESLSWRVTVVQPDGTERRSVTFSTRLDSAH